MSGTHAFFPPSGAGQWVHCAMWPHMNAKHPDADHESAAEGEAAHWVLLHHEARIGDRAPNSIAITLEMLEGDEVWQEATGGAQPGDLESVEMHVADARDPQRGGTPDRWRMSFASPPGPRLTVFDYKFGHEFVDAFENWQCIEYARLIARGPLELNGLQEQHVRVEFVVVQPRYYAALPIRRWSPGTLADLRGYWNRLDAAVAAARQPQPVATPGAHCKHCPGRHECPAAAHAASWAADLATRSTPVELSLGALGRELAMLDQAAAMLEARRTGLQAQALANLKAGKAVPGYVVEHGEARERWRVPIPEVIALGQALGVPLAKPDALTPNQARKAGLDPAIVAAFAERPPGAAKLVRDDGRKARQAFAN